MTSVFDSRAMRRVWAGLVLAWLALSPTIGRAQEQAPLNDEEQLDAHTRTAARNLAAQAAEAFERQEYEEALDLFQRAGSLIQAPTIALMEARTLAARGSRRGAPRISA